MELRVDVSTQRVELCEGGDLKRFSVRAFPDAAGAGAAGGLARALRANDAGRVDPSGDALIPPAAIRRLAHRAATEAGTALDPAWEAEFSSMLDDAATRGWISGDGSVQAHVEWEA